MSRKRVDFEVSKDALQSACRSCGAPVVWIVVEPGRSGKVRRMPLDVKSAVEGLDGSTRMESHFAHCPQAEEWRKARS